MIAIVRSALAQRYSVDMLSVAAGLTKGLIKALIDVDGELLHETFNHNRVTLGAWNKKIWKDLLDVR